MAAAVPTETQATHESFNCPVNFRVAPARKAGSPLPDHSRPGQALGKRCFNSCSFCPDRQLLAVISRAGSTCGLGPGESTELRNTCETSACNTVASQGAVLITNLGCAKGHSEPCFSIALQKEPELAKQKSISEINKQNNCVQSSTSRCIEAFAYKRTNTYLK